MGLVWTDCYDFLLPFHCPKEVVSNNSESTKTPRSIMVNWSDPAEIARDAIAFERLIFVILGVVIWEIVSTWDFEWSLINKRRRFRWPLGTKTICLLDCLRVYLFSVFFFFSRYCIVSAIVGLIVSLTVSDPINCGALYIFNSWSGNMTILCSSTSLMLRTIALWERKRNVVIPLGVLCIAFWAILYRTMFIVHAEWEEESQTCVVVSSSPSLLNVTFFFTMAFDFIILAYTFVALTAKHTIRTDLWKLLFRDGLIYFLATFSANCIPAVLNVLNLNTPMNVIATIPAAVIRAVMRLLEFNQNDGQYVPSVSVVSIGGSSNTHTAFRRVSVKPSPQVLVTTEHITMSEFPKGAGSPRSSNKSKSRSFDLERDAPERENFS
ncbi:hypothetical protein D9758_001254 [Tetrapyrgos nigripes]|uniref:Uncharacterized protein n=1 Tax=Tetrapyrgos nigripes TaxID=182062 RepID=A0A8H5GRU7_9AGAR|nr:hypothetical protein D9758_001254 [Tetrapyrgos nigripes]